jgi:hypothetical protein
MRRRRLCPLQCPRLGYLHCSCEVCLLGGRRGDKSFREEMTLTIIIELCMSVVARTTYCLWLPVLERIISLVNCGSPAKNEEVAFTCGLNGIETFVGSLFMAMVEGVSSLMVKPSF